MVAVGSSAAVAAAAGSNTGGQHELMEQSMSQCSSEQLCAVEWSVLQDAELNAATGKTSGRWSQSKVAVCWVLLP